MTFIKIRIFKLTKCNNCLKYKETITLVEYSIFSSNQKIWLNKLMKLINSINKKIKMFKMLKNIFNKNKIKHMIL